jgi:hypothetical protein
MRLPLACAALLLLSLGVVAADGNKDLDKDKDKEKDTGEKLVSLGRLVGVLQATGGSSGDLTLRVTVPTLEANPQEQANLVRQQQEVLLRQQVILRLRNPVQRQQQMAQLLQSAQRLMQTQQNLFRVKRTQVDVPLQLGDDVKVRSLTPPRAFDDKGNVKRYTAKELKELRGPGDLPGFAADRDHLEEGQTVLVKVSIKKLKDKPANKLTVTEDKPIVTLVLIVSEPK